MPHYEIKVFCNGEKPPKLKHDLKKMKLKEKCQDKAFSTARNIAKIEGVDKVEVHYVDDKCISSWFANGESIQEA